MKPAGGAQPSGHAAQRAAELRVVGTSVAREVELLLDRLAQAVGRRAPRVLQVGSRTLVSDRNERNWRGLLLKRFASKVRFVGIDLLEGGNVDKVLDVCSSPKAWVAALGKEPFDLVICCHVLEHTREPQRAARNIENMLGPGGLAYTATPWSQAFHATPDDYWRFSVRGLMLMFGRLEILSSFYSGGDVGLAQHRTPGAGRAPSEHGHGQQAERRRRHRPDHPGPDPGRDSPLHGPIIAARRSSFP